jgi:hypothetical protein
MAVEHLKVHLHYPIPLEAFDKIVHMEPRLAWVHGVEDGGWIPKDSWKISCVPSRH